MSFLLSGQTMPATTFCSGYGIYVCVTIYNYLLPLSLDITFMNQEAQAEQVIPRYKSITVHVIVKGYRKR